MMRKLFLVFIILSLLLTSCNDKSVVTPETSKKNEMNGELDKVIFNDPEKNDDGTSDIIKLKKIDEFTESHKIHGTAMVGNELNIISSMEYGGDLNYSITDIFINNELSQDTQMSKTYSILMDGVVYNGRYYTLESDEDGIVYFNEYKADTFEILHTVDIEELIDEVQGSMSLKAVSDKLYLFCGQNVFCMNEPMKFSNIIRDNSIAYSQCIDSDYNCYDFSREKMEEKFVFTKQNSNGEIVYQNSDFSDMPNTSYSYGIFNYAKKTSAVYVSDGEKMYINIVNNDTGKTAERYEIEKCDKLWGGVGGYDFIGKYGLSLFGYDTETGNRDILYESAVDNAEFDVSGNNEEIHIYEKYIDLPVYFSLCKINSEGEVLAEKELFVSEEIYSSMQNLVLQPDYNGEGIYFVSIGFDGTSSVCYIDSSDEFNFMFDTEIWIEKICEDKDGLLWIAGYDGSAGMRVIRAYDKNGELKKSFDGQVDYIHSLNFCLDSVHVVFGVEDSEKVYCEELDVAKEVLEKNKEIQVSSESKMFFNTFSEDSVKVCYYDAAKNMVCAYDYENQVSECVVELENIQLVNNFYVFPNKCLVLLSDNDIYISEMVNSEAEVITVAGFGINSHLNSQIEKYNLSQNDYKIECIDYNKYSYGEGDSFFSGSEKLDEDIINENIPDIIVFSENFDYTKYQDMGIFSDMYEFVKNDSEIDISSYNDNILKLFEYDGKLMHMPVDFDVLSVGVSDEAVDSMSLDEYSDMFINSWDNLDVDVYTFEHMMLSSIIYQYVDYKESVCNFENEDFEKVLKLIKILREKYSESEDNVYGQKTSGTRIFISPVSEYISEVLKTNDVNYYFAGICNDMGIYHYIEYYTGVAISSQSLHKEEAWSFIKKYLLNDDNIKLDIQQYVKKIISIYNDEIMSRGEKPITYNSDDFEKLYEFYQKPSSVNLSQTAVYKIVIDEVEPYFNGQITVKEAIANVQNMVKRYFDEK